MQSKTTDAEAIWKLFHRDGVEGMEGILLITVGVTCKFFLVFAIEYDSSPQKEVCSI